MLCKPAIKKLPPEGPISESSKQKRYYEANRDKIAEGQRELRDYRLSLGLSQRSFAALLGVSQASICYWETISPPKDWKEIIKNTTAMRPE